MLAALTDPVPFEWVSVIVLSLVTALGVVWKAWQESRKDTRVQWERINQLEDRAAEREKTQDVFRAEALETLRAMVSELVDLRRSRAP